MQEGCESFYVANKHKPRSILESFFTNENNQVTELNRVNEYKLKAKIVTVS